MAAFPISSRLSSTKPERVAEAARATTREAVERSFPDRTTLTAKDRIVLRAVAEAMFSEDGEVPRARLDALVGDVDAYISSASKPLRAGLRFALFVVRLAPVLFFFRLAAIEKLSVKDRVTILSRLERSPLAHLSLAFIGWRTVMTFVFYEHPEELATLGYVHERKVHKRRLAVVPAAEESGVRLRGADAEADADDESEVA